MPYDTAVNAPGMGYTLTNMYSNVVMHCEEVGWRLRLFRPRPGWFANLCLCILPCVGFSLCKYRATDLMLCVFYVAAVAWATRVDGARLPKASVASIFNIYTRHRCIRCIHRIHSCKKNNTLLRCVLHFSPRRYSLQLIDMPLLPPYTTTTMQ